MNDFGRIDHLELQREQLLAEVRRSTGLHRRLRAGSIEEDRARTWAQKAIKRTLAKLSNAHPTLAEHLEENLKTGRSCVYDCTMTWVTTPKK